MSNNNPIRFAVVGLGHIGTRHAEMIQRHPEAILVAGVDIQPDKQLKFAKEIPCFDSIKSFLASGIQTDVVVIATPNGLHAPMAVEVMQAGMDVVIEKPMALSKRDAQQIIQVSEQTGRNVFNVMQNRYSPPSVWIRDLVGSGKLGRIFMVQLNCFWNRDERYYLPHDWHGTADLDGGVLFTQFSHFVDMMVWLFGDIINIQTRFFNFNHQNLTSFPDSGVACFDFVDGGSGTMQYSTSVWDKNMESSMTIIAENGSVRIGGQYMEKLEYCHIKNHTSPVLPPTNPGNDYGAYRGSAQNHHQVIQNVVDVLLRQKPIDVKSNEGLLVVDVIERIIHSRTD